MKKLLFLLVTIQISLFAKPFIPLKSGDTVEGHVNYLEKKYYELEVYKEQTVTIKLTNLTADVDMYIGTNYKPKIRSNDCYSSNSNRENEECILTVPAPYAGKSTSIIVMVYGFKESNYKLEVISKDGAEALPELSSTPLDGTVSKGEGKQYKFLGKKGEEYTTALFNLSADADLRVSIGRRAGLRTFTCKSIFGGTTNDKCTITLKEDAPVYVQVYGYRAASYKIEVLKSPDNPPVTLAKLKEMIANGDDVTKVNTSAITDMSDLFKDNREFNQNIHGWDVSNVTNMSNMFAMSIFDQDIGSWDVSNVTDMSYMFFWDPAFNQDISNWDVSKVTNMTYMFNSKDRCSDFNQNIEKWNVSKVINMNWMLPSNQQGQCIWTNKENPFKNHDLSVWNVSSVTTHIGFMDDGARDYNIVEPKWSK